MNYDETLNYIHSLPKFSRTLGNTLLKKLLDKLDNPQNSMKFVHIGGTNGKGSTSTMVSCALKNAGYKVGLFTSPYLVRFNERIRINGEPISDDDLALFSSRVREISEKYDAPVSEFAFDTAVALQYFKHEKCDIVVLEVGLGGKLDATNVIENPLAIGLTAIGLDHCQYLGDTTDLISKEKFGIIKPRCDVVLYPVQDDIVLKNAQDICQKNNSKLNIPNLNRLEILSINPTEFSYKNKTYSPAMDGEFQIYNAITAIEIIEILKNKGFLISDENTEYGINHAKIDGRMDFISENICLDGAHNPQAIKASLNSLKKINRKICFITAVMEDKDYETIVKNISEFAKIHSSKIVATDIDMPRCLTKDKLSGVFEKYGISASILENKDITEFIKFTANKDTLVCVLGSLYLVGNVKMSLS